VASFASVILPLPSCEKRRFQIFEVDHADFGVEPLNGVSKGGEHPLWSRPGSIPRPRSDFVNLPNRVYYGDRGADLPLVLGDLLDRYRRVAEPVTFTCVAPGDGRRSAIDRDLDGYLDGDEILAGSDPADSKSVPRQISQTK
jgi:hypothetical protein